MTPPLYNFLQFNIVACTEAEAPQEEDETSNPGLLLVSGRSELDFSSCCCSWKFLICFCQWAARKCTPDQWRVTGVLSMLWRIICSGFSCGFLFVSYSCKITSCAYVWFSDKYMMTGSVVWCNIPGLFVGWVLWWKWYLYKSTYIFLSPPSGFTVKKWHTILTHKKQKKIYFSDISKKIMKIDTML